MACPNSRVYESTAYKASVPLSATFKPPGSCRLLETCFGCYWFVPSARCKDPKDEGLTIPGNQLATCIASVFGEQVSFCRVGFLAKKSKVQQLNALTTTIRIALSFALLGSIGVAQEGTYDWSNSRSLADGIRYAKASTDTPRKMVIHCLQIDVTNPRIDFHTTGRSEKWELGKTETKRQTTRNFVRELREKQVPVVVAINADAFSPWPAPYAEETETDLLGLAVSDSTIVSESGNTPSLTISTDRQVNIDSDVDQEERRRLDTAISGFGLCLANGVVPDSGDDVHPRTAIGLSANKGMLYLMVIDGRQPSSHGATVSETGRWLLYFGAADGINLDGGGSTTMAFWNEESESEDKCELLNSPVGNSQNAMYLPAALFKPTERANGNNLAISINDQSEQN